MRPLFVVCLFVTGWAGTCPAVVTLDQSQLSSGDCAATPQVCAGLVSDSVSLIAQTFTAGLSGPLTKVTLPLVQRHGTDGAHQPVPPGYLTVELTAADLTIARCNCIAGDVTVAVPGLVLASVTIPAASIPYPTYGAVDVVFPTPATVVAGTSYAILLRAEDVPGDVLGSAGHEWLFGRSTADLYPAGARMTYNPAGGYWCVQTPLCWNEFIDYLFESWVDVEAVPVEGTSFGGIKAHYRD
jgi:hypothetical protein